MSASRVLHIPLSGRDRRHYGNELRKAQRELERLTREAEAARAAADRALATTVSIASCCRPDCSLVARISHRRRSPMPFMADTNCSKSNAATATMRRPST